MAGLENIETSFSTRLQSLMADAPGHVGVASGYRSPEQQKYLWDRSDKSGKMVAAPGHSHHERGLAVDLSFADANTKKWVHDHAAEYGLYFPMSWEDWHIEPAGSRDANDPKAYTTPPPGTDRVGGFLDMILGRRPMTGGDGGAAPAETTAGTPAPEGATADYRSAYKLILDAGGSSSEAALLAAIAGPESGYKTGAHNPDASTGDDSYGLWQINMLGSMGPNRRKQFGISSNDQLYDPATNAKAALAIFRTQGPNAWSGYKSGAYREFMGDV